MEVCLMLVVWSTYSIARQLIHTIHTCSYSSLGYKPSLRPSASASHLIRASVSDKIRSGQYYYKLIIILEYNTVQKSSANIESFKKFTNQ